MTTHPENPIVIDDFDATELRYAFDPQMIIDTMADNCMTFFIFQYQYRKTQGDTGLHSVEYVNTRAAFLRTLNSFHRAITHPADPRALDILHEIARKAEEQLLPIFEEHGIDSDVFGNYGAIYEQAGKEALRLQVTSDLGRGKTFEIQSYAGLS